ncbi:MAG: hypothetical protein ILO42_01325, partial [Clostridia bacterium]|nr:hypothetical protein [Clostridia bacterium]
GKVQVADSANTVSLAFPYTSSVFRPRLAVEDEIHLPHLGKAKQRRFASSTAFAGPGLGEAEASPNGEGKRFYSPATFTPLTSRA